MKTLAVNNISKSYGSARVLKNISLEFAGTGIHAVVGESGSGKTTLLRIIAGLVAPDSGTVSLGENDITETRPEKRNIGLVFQDYALFPHLTVFQNIAYGIPKLSRKSRQQRVEELLEEVQLTNIDKRYPAELSGGQQQRVAIARALAPAPGLMLFDEPFSNLDPIRRADLRDMVQKLSAKTDTTSLIVTHDISDAIKLADSITVLESGKTVQQGTPDDLINQPATAYVEKLMGDTNLEISVTDSDDE